MDVGAIVLIEAQRGNDESRSPSGVADSTAAAKFAGEALAFVDVLGRSVVEHTVGWLRSANVKCTSLIVHSDLATSLPVFRQACGDLSIRVAEQEARRRQRAPAVLLHRDNSIVQEPATPPQNPQH